MAQQGFSPPRHRLDDSRLSGRATLSLCFKRGPSHVASTSGYVLVRWSPLRALPFLGAEISISSLRLSESLKCCGGSRIRTCGLCDELLSHLCQLHIRSLVPSTTRPYLLNMLSCNLFTFFRSLLINLSILPNRQDQKPMSKKINSKRPPAGDAKHRKKSSKTCTLCNSLLCGFF